MYDIWGICGELDIGERVPGVITEVQVRAAVALEE